jgi:nitroreductase/dihydropteridine reductase
LKGHSRQYGMNIINALQWRYATKKFDATKKISAQDVDELLEVLRLSPSSFGLQPWKFVVVKNPALRQQLKGAAWNQAQITDASHLIVLCARTDLNPAFVRTYIEHTAEARKASVESLKGFEDMMLGSINTRSKDAVVDWNKHQVYLALGMLLEVAALKGIDACPMEGFDPAQFDKILGLKDCTSAVVCALGYRAADDVQHAKVRFPKKDVIIEK